MVMAGTGLAACVGGRAHRRRVLRPAHGGIVQLNGTGSFTGGQGCRRHKESTNGLPCSLVYVRWRPVEVRRRQSGVSGEVVFCLWARGASLSSGEASQGVRRGRGGLEWPVYGGRGSQAAGTPFSGQTPVNSCSGRVGSAQGHTVEARVGFIATGAGMGARLMRRGAARTGPSAGACSGVARARRTRGRVNLPEFLRLLSTHTCESCHMNCVRFLPCT
jgi:hypothetical protein